MPYANYDALPDDVKERFSKRCAEVWREVWNETYERHEDEGRAFATAEKAGQQCMKSRAESRAEWDTAYVNDLPDSAFACPDERKYPHHNAEGNLDVSHLRNAWSRVNQQGTSSCGYEHIRKHMKAEGLLERSDTQAVSKQDKALVSLIGPERRFVEFDATDVDPDGDVIAFRGHAAVFDKPAYIGTEPFGFWEQVSRGAFKQAINRGDVRMLHNHDPNLVLARQANGTLRLAEDETGLAVEADMAPTSYARDLAVLLKRGDVNQMSFSFQPVQQGFVEGPKGDDVRELREVKVFDVSTVTFPAYNETDAALRSFGLELLTDSLDLTDDQHARLVGAIRTGAVTPDLAPVLRAASEALGGLAQKFEPDEESSRAQDIDVELARRVERARRRYQSLAAMSGEYR